MLVQELGQRRASWAEKIGIVLGSIGAVGAVATVLMLTWGDNLYGRWGSAAPPPPREVATGSAPQPSATAPSEGNPTESDLLAMADNLPRRSVPSPGRVDQEVWLSGANAASAWTTNYFPYTPDNIGSPAGLADERLRVGGWGDTYVSLVKFELPDRRLVRRAILVLYLDAADNPTSHPTPMILGAVTRSWDWKVGERFLWSDRPQSDPIAILPGPSGTQPSYEIDITDIYNEWASGRRVNEGVILTPMNNSNNDFNVFFSTRASPAQRPRVQLTY